MKRSGPPKRKKPLRADPDATAAWHARSRESAIERARGKPHVPRPAREVAKPTKKGKPRKPVKFRAKSPAREHTCARCGKRRATTWHHWLPQQQIRVYVRGLRLSEQSSRAMLLKLLPDERNLVALCWPCHDAHELRSSPLSGDEMPYEAKLFALELGTEWAERLRRMYPGGQR